MTYQLSHIDEESLVDIDFDWLDMHFRQGRLDELERMCGLIRARPDISPAQLCGVQLFEGSIALRRGDHARAEELLVAALQGPPNVRIRAQAMRGVARSVVGDLAGAGEILQPLAETANPDFTALIGWGRVLASRGDEAGAWRVFLRVLEIEPTSVDAIHEVMRLGMSAERLPLVRRLLERFVDIEPENLDVRCLLAATYAATRDDAQAAREVRRVVAFAGIAPLGDESRQILESVSKLLTQSTVGG